LLKIRLLQGFFLCVWLIFVNYQKKLQKNNWNPKNFN
jgi:hypothetical protein